MNDYIQFATQYPNPRGSLCLPRLLVTGRYINGGETPVSILMDHFRPVSRQAHGGKPCFFTAENRDDYWRVTRYVGGFNDAGGFEGAKTTHVVGMSTGYVQHVIVRCLSGWDSEQNRRKRIQLPYMFKHALKINP